MMARDRIGPARAGIGRGVALRASVAQAREDEVHDHAVMMR